MRKVARQRVNEGASREDLSWCTICFKLPYIWDDGLGVRILDEIMKECLVVWRPYLDAMEYMSPGSSSPTPAHEARRFEGRSVILEEAEDKVKDFFAELVWLEHSIKELLKDPSRYQEE